MLKRHDSATAEHSVRVRRYALALAKELNLSAKLKRKLGIAALLHDVGKIAISSDMLNKPGALNFEERRQIEEHPNEGHRLLTTIFSDATLLAAVRGHHERFDGTGYPDGLRGDEIPYLARIICIADCFDALTSRRSYRTALSFAEGLKELQRNAGSQFDPEMVEAFVKVAPKDVVATPSFCSDLNPLCEFSDFPMSATA
ncbi:MAG TPA: HD-GYP domain-containing protein [Gemmataceae bacterium]|nr:HD-GYP domain-containing protein [Gemmataceae bacterium]